MAELLSEALAKRARARASEAASDAQAAIAEGRYDDATALMREALADLDKADQHDKEQARTRAAVVTMAEVAADPAHRLDAEYWVGKAEQQAVCRHPTANFCDCPPGTPEAGSHRRKECPYCREGRWCPTQAAERLAQE